VRQHVFNVVVSSASRVLVVRDRLLGRIQRDLRVDATHVGVSRHAISSGGNLLDAVMVRPDAEPAQACVLICHGIGETVQHWLPVQRLLAASGVASLVFDYSGYGRSTGRFNAAQAERDAIAAFEFLVPLAEPLPVALLGFSLGSGIAAAIVAKVPAQRLLLCAAFTSIRKAAASIGLPKVLALQAPALWDAEISLCDCPVPVLVVHGEKDPLFPVKMAEELAGYCGSKAELVIVPKLTHNQPFYRPELAYWGVVISWLAADSELLPGEAEPEV
jgi:pimeloyl-ACP methyl ester carboxylesterase